MIIKSYLGFSPSVYILCAGTLVNRAGTFLMPFLTLYLVGERGLSKQFATLALGIHGAAAIIGVLLGGYLADRAGRRVVMIASLVGGMVVLLVFGEIHWPAGILSAVGAFALVAEMYRPAAQAMLADLVEPERRTQAFGLMYVAINLGFALGAYVGGQLAVIWFQWLFWGDAATAGLYALILVFLIKETLPAKSAATADEMLAGPAESPLTAQETKAVEGRLDAFKHILGNGTFLLFCAASLLCGLVYMQAMSTLPLFLNELGFGANEYGTMISLNGWMIVLFQLPITAWIIRFHRGNALAFAALLLAIGFGLKAMAVTTWQFQLTVLIWTTGEMIQAPLVSSVVSDMSPVEYRGRYMSVFSMCYSTANMLGATDRRSRVGLLGWSNVVDELPVGRTCRIGHVPEHSPRACNPGFWSRQCGSPVISVSSLEGGMPVSCGFRALTSVLVALIAVQPLALAEGVVRDHRIVADDYFSIGVVASCAFSPDAKQVVYTELRWEPPADARNLDLWIVDRESKAFNRLTFDSAADGNPTWSPDGQWIYFTSNRKQGEASGPPYDGKTQVWRIRPDGSGLFPVTRIEDGVDDYDLSADGEALYYVVSEEGVEEEWKDLREKHEHITYGHGVVEFSQIWKLDLHTWRSEKLVDEKRVIGDMAVSPDQRRIAMITTPTNELISNEGRSRVDIYDTQTEELVTLDDQLWRKDAPSPYGWLESLAWAGHSKSLAFRVDFDGYPGEILVARFDADEPAIQKLTRPSEVIVSPGHMEWMGDLDTLCFIGEDHARARVYCITRIKGGKQVLMRVLTPGDVAVKSFNTSKSGGDITAVLSTVSHPPDVFAATIKPKTEPALNRLTNSNRQVDTWKIPQIKTVSWKGWNGDDVQGILELPPDYKEGDGPLPMIVEIHGGPTAASLLEFRFWIYGRVLMASRGYAVLSPNYRGSTGYGDRFLTELVGHKNDRDVVDILSGVDAMVAAGIADVDRLGVMGWSNGGYLTNCLITATERFKVASSGAGVFDVVMQWSAEDTPGHVINFQKGFPWDKPAEMQAASPLYQADKITTPTIIHVGENDPRCPPAHSKALFRALHEYIKTPTELVIYPDTGHSPVTYKNRKAKLDWDLAWFDKYLPVTSDDTKQAETAIDPA